MGKVFQFLTCTSLLLFFTACQSSQNNASNASIPEGKKIFEATCVRCHGMNGAGLTGPSLLRPKLKHVSDLASFTKVVEQGLAGTGMPGSWIITDEDCRHLYAFINDLKNQEQEMPKGDSTAGSLVYMSAGCPTCHVMHGLGNSIGPDLSEIGASRNAAYLHQSIVDPAATLPESTDLENGYGFSMYLPVKIRTAEGKEITGLRINEDTYTIQLKDIANQYYSFNKEQLRAVEKLYGQSLMPSYVSKLSEQEIENLVAFLYKSGNQ